MEPRTGWVYDPAFLRHNDSIAHPESPARLTAILRRLNESGMINRMETIPATAASDDDLLRVHTHAHVRTLEGSEGQWLDPDTFVGRGSPEIARLAAGAVIGAALKVWTGTITNAFCAVRPPGHHALRDRAMGFCLYNNIALAAAAVRSADPDARVFILDWDVHHGNGTQAIFYEDPAVLYASVHQFPFYPGTGAACEVGRGPGEGTTVNKPLHAGSGDCEFLEAIGQIIEEHARPFNPAMVLISAGFDAHTADPLGGLNVTTDGFTTAARLVCDFAQDVCGGRVVSVLEGGYNTVVLAECVESHLSVLMDAAQVGKGSPE